MIQDETQGWTERWGKRDFRDINSPPCFLAFSLSFFNLISSKVFIPKFKLSSGSTEQFRKCRRILPKILGINPGHTAHELKTPEQVGFRKTGSFFHPPREKSTLLSTDSWRGMKDYCIPGIWISTVPKGTFSDISTPLKLFKLHWNSANSL